MMGLNFPSAKAANLSSKTQTSFRADGVFESCLRFRLFFRRIISKRNLFAFPLDLSEIPRDRKTLGTSDGATHSTNVARARRTPVAFRRRSRSLHHQRSRWSSRSRMAGALAHESRSR